MGKEAAEGNGFGEKFRDAVAQAQFWRIAALVVVAAGAFLVPSAVYQVVPQSAAGFHFKIKVNRWTGEACLLLPPTAPRKRFEGLVCD